VFFASLALAHDVVLADVSIDHPADASLFPAQGLSNLDLGESSRVQSSGPTTPSTRPWTAGSGRRAWTPAGSSPLLTRRKVGGLGSCYNEVRPHSASGQKTPISLTDHRVAPSQPPWSKPENSSLSRSKVWGRSRSTQHSRSRWTRNGGYVSGSA